MKRFILILFLISCLKAFETNGSVWYGRNSASDVGNWNQAVYNAILNWKVKRDWLGPANIIFTTGERVVVKWASIGEGKLGMFRCPPDPSCKYLQEIILQSLPLTPLPKINFIFQLL